jgi:hypothetical protein
MQSAAEHTSEYRRSASVGHTRVLDPAGSGSVKHPKQQWQCVARIAR